MVEIPKLSGIDTVVTSPPYNIGIKYDNYDDKEERYKYLKWVRSWLVALERIGVKQIFLNIHGKPTDPMVPYQVLSVACEIFKLQNTIYWIKSLSVGDEPCIGHVKPIGGGRFLNDCVEHIFHLTRDGFQAIDRLAIGVPYADKSNLGRGEMGKNGDNRCRGNAWVIGYETTVGEKSHPAAYPVKLAEMCIKLSGGRHILDPFCGSGSTLVAAQRVGVQATGIEISEEYAAGTRISVGTVARDAAS